jgi:hypothetical protein
MRITSMPVEEKAQHVVSPRRKASGQKDRSLNTAAKKRYDHVPKSNANRSLLKEEGCMNDVILYPRLLGNDSSRLA